ncbi:DMT family transporter [Salinispirillum sp. LH 10-3-1]|uniref:DMT family transporter n=1 Tax=Salinispirillum sp. LH 10-3-1 TaxID=2952525 RepID=A0AB38YIL3_9GAMM
MQFYRSLDRERQGMMLGFSAVLLWSTVATAFKLALNAWPLIGVLWLSSTVSLVLFSTVLWRLGLLLKSVKWLRRYWRRALLMGMLNPVIYYFTLFAAYDQLSAQVAQPINYTWAFVLSLMAAIWLKAPVRWRDWQGMALGYLGVMVLVMGAQGRLEVTLPGVLLAILSTFFWALYWVVGMRDKRPPLVAMFHHFLVAWPVLTIILLWQGIEFMAVPAGWLPSLYIGLFEMGLAFLFWMTALQRVKNTAKVANLIFIAPFLSLIWVFLILKEPILATSPIGLGLILLGQWWQRRRV